MKKSFFIFCLLACFGFAVAQHYNHTSQTVSKAKTDKIVWCNIYFGPTVDWFAPTVNNLTRNAAKAGFLGGLNVDVGVTKNNVVNVSTGVLFRYLQGELGFLNIYNIPFINPEGNIFEMLAQTPIVRTYQTYYVAIPTGIKVKTKVADRFVFGGQLGLYHNFKVGGKKFDKFSLGENNEYFITKAKEKNNEASLFAESGYIGLGLEYLLGNNTSFFTNFNYSCQFNYFNSNAKNNITDERFKSMIHSLHIVVGFSF